MSKTIKKTALAAALTLAASGVLAADVYVDVGTDLDGDGNTVTDNFANIGLFPNALSVYTEQAASAACPACGIDGILKNGEILNFTDSGEVLAQALNPLNGLVDSTELFNTAGGWGLNAVYNVSGLAQVVTVADIDTTTVALGTEFAAGQGLLPSFQSGFIDIFLVSSSIGTNGQQLLRLNLVAPTGGADIANVVLDGVIDYSWYAGGDPFVEDFFNFADGTSFYDLAGMAVAEVLWRADFNVDPNLIPYNDGGDPNYDPAEFPPASNPFPFSGDCGQGELCRASNLNMTVRFDTVPEPVTLALMGLGLGLIGSRIRKSAMS